MPISQNPKETGWFYHAPEKKRVNVDRVEYPAPSQIPGIGYEDPTLLEKEEVQEMMFKETDSKYIRMAKLGGRKDLLQFNPERYGEKSKEPKGYNRSDWFYLEDNRLEDEEKKEAEKREWEFLLPEYMVHKGYQASFSNPATPPSRGKVPYHTDKNMTDNEREAREGRSATDKMTVKIPEVRRPGYGVRNEKPPVAVQKTLEAPKRGRRVTTTHNEKSDPTSMQKLMGGEYGREWQASNDKPTKPAMDAGQRQNILNQLHDDMYGKKAAPTKTNQEEEKDMFKLSRFQNIPSKVDSHQRPEILAAAK